MSKELIEMWKHRALTAEMCHDGALQEVAELEERVERLELLLDDARGLADSMCTTALSLARKLKDMRCEAG